MVKLRDQRARRK
uniref:Uncharacterized protein n=1 Tax=Rhizophora mucronata TaxID=61149 RepID=A0A2P2ITI0_RHIMU